jgi:hypothetical protein
MRHPLREHAGPDEHGQHEAADGRDPAIAHERGRREAVAEILRQMADAVEPVESERPRPADQEDRAEPGAAAGRDAIPGFGPGRERKQRDDEQDRPRRERDAGRTVQDGGDHLDLPAVDPDVRRKRSRVG